MSYHPKPLVNSNIELPPDISELVEHLAKKAHDIWVAQRPGRIPLPKGAGIIPLYPVRWPKPLSAGRIEPVSQPSIKQFCRWLFKEVSHAAT